MRNLYCSNACIFCCIQIFRAWKTTSCSFCAEELHVRVIIKIEIEREGERWSKPHVYISLRTLREVNDHMFVTFSVHLIVICRQSVLLWICFLDMGLNGCPICGNKFLYGTGTEWFYVWIHWLSILSFEPAHAHLQG